MTTQLLKCPISDMKLFILAQIKHKIHSYVLALLISLFAALLNIEIVQSNTRLDEHCEILLSDSSSAQFEGDEQLLYSYKDENYYTLVRSTNRSFQAQSSSGVRATAVSPDGTQFALLEVSGVFETRKVELRVISLTTEVETQIPLYAWSTGGDANHPSGGVEPYGFQWLSNEEIIFYYATLVNQPLFYYFSIVNVASTEIRYVHPFNPIEVEPEVLPSTPLYPDSMVKGYAPAPLSPNGQFVFYISTPTSTSQEATFRPHIFDIEQRMNLDLKNLPSIAEPDVIWSSDSDHIYWVSNETDRSIIYRYSLQTDASEAIYISRISDETQNTTWQGIYTLASPSPDDRLSFEEVTSNNRSNVLIVDVATGQVTNTCVHRSTNQASWSRDGRYLAAYGVLEGETDRETGSVYIYDTLENQIYEVYRGQADIIGWMANPE
jgi:hypothetical protein